MGFEKGYVPWNKGKPAWNKGIKGIYKKSELDIERLRNRMIGNQYSKGKNFSEEHKRKISMALKGRMPKNINLLINNCKGRKHTDITKEKLKEINKNNPIRYWQGKKRHITSEHREKINNTLRKRYNNGEIVSWSKGKKQSKDTIEKRIMKIIGRKNTEETRIKMSKIQKDKIASNPNRIKNFLEARKNIVFPLRDTTIEVKIQNFLKQLNIEFFTHQYMHIEHGYQCDILVPSMKLVIECDGDYWHGGELYKENLSERQKIQIENDLVRTRELIERGYRVLRLWEHDIKRMNEEDLKNKLDNIKTNG